MDGRRRVVDLDVRRASLDQPLQLGAEDRYERLGRGIPGRVDLAEPGSKPARQRVRAGQGDLERTVRPFDRVAELFDDAQTVWRGDALEHLEAMLLVVPARAQPTVRG